MNLRELKKMIAEEYSAYTEQAGPALDVDAGDVDAARGVLTDEIESHWISTFIITVE